MTKEERQLFIIEWNNNFPVDRWWREKHKIPFMSKAHREVIFLHQLLEYEEDVLFLEAEKSKKDTYVFDSGDLFKEVEKENVKEKSIADQIKDANEEMKEFKKTLADGRSEN